MTNTTRTRPPARVQARAKRRFPLTAVVVAAGGALALATMLVSAVVDDGPAPPRPGIEETRPVTAEGRLAPPGTGPDPAVGTAAPTVRGASFDGTPVTIGADGRPKVVVFLAHWCPHCRAELPHLVGWLDDGVARGVDVYAVSTAARADRPNWPPSRWLSEAGWSRPVLADDAPGTAATAFGLPGTPYYVAIDAAGTVARRVSGEVGRDGFAALVAAAAATP